MEKSNLDSHPEIFHNLIVSIVVPKDSGTRKNVSE